MAILFVGIDLAKNVFAVHGVNEHGKAVLVRPTVQRAKLHELVASLPVCTIGMDGSTMSRSNRRMSRLTNGAPARVFHQGPQHSALHE